MEEVEHVKKRDRHKSEIAKVDGALDAFADRLQQVQLFGSDEKCVASVRGRTADRHGQRRTGFLNRDFMLPAIVRQQGKEKISVTEASPGNIAAELMTFDGFRWRLALDLVVDQRDEPFERRIVVRHGMIALIRKQNFWYQDSALGGFYADFKTNGIGCCRETERLGNNRSVASMSLKNQPPFSVASQFEILALHTINHRTVIRWRRSLPTNRQRQGYSRAGCDHFVRGTILVRRGAKFLKLKTL